MSIEQRNPRKRWRSAGAVIVVAAVVLVGFALFFAVSQPRTVSLLHIAAAQNEAIQIRSSATGQIRRVAARRLVRVVQHYAGGGRDDPFDGARQPRWLTDYIVWNGERLLWWGAAGPGGKVLPVASELRAEVQERVAQRFSAMSDAPHEPLGFVKSVAGGQPFVIAYLVSDVGAGRTVLAGALIDLDLLRKDLLEPLFAVSGRLSVVRQPERLRTFWYEPISEVMPLVVTPSEQFVASEFRAARIQQVILVAIAIVFLIVLALMVWKLITLVERELRLSELKSNFVADVSHELKTPLALIRMFGEMLSEGRVPSEEKKQEYYGIITRESTRLTQLIENILDFSRIEAGRKTYHLAPVDIGQVVRATYENYRAELNQKGFTHTLRVADGLPTVSADADAVAQAMVNLMSNAIKYSAEEKEFEIEIKTETRRDRHGVLISVKDRGIGVSPEDRSRLFDGFFRATDDRVRQVRGTGLGLSVVHQIVGAHGGSIDVESRLVKGSVFRIFLPASSADLKTGDENDSQ